MYEISNFKNESAERYSHLIHEVEDAFINLNFFKTMLQIKMILENLWNPGLFSIKYTVTIKKIAYLWHESIH